MDVLVRAANDLFLLALIAWDAWGVMVFLSLLIVLGVLARHVWKIRRES